MTVDKDVRATIIVLVYNTPDLLVECLQAFYDSLHPKKWQIIVVDNGSARDVRPIVEGRFPGVDVIRSEQNRGFAAGNNLGLRAAKGEYVILINSDVIARGRGSRIAGGSRLFRTWRGRHESGTSYGAGGAAGVCLRRRNLSRLPGSAGNASVLGFGSMHNWSMKEPLDVGWVSAACLCVRSKVIEEIGELDERFPLYFEDVDWCMRMRKAGWRIVYNPRLQVTHLGGASRPGGSVDRRELYYRSLLLSAGSTTVAAGNG